MYSAQVVEILSNRGIATNAYQLRYAIARGAIPRPEMDRSLQFVYTMEHVDLFERYFVKKLVRRCERV